MKKLLSVLVAIAILFSVMPNAFATGETVMAEESIEYITQAIETVKALGLMTGYVDGSFKPDGNLTRAEFACVMSNLLGNSPDLKEGQTTQFYDVTAAHWASPCIKFIASRGIMHGYDDGNFYPEKNISINEAVTVIITVMEYDFIAKNKGGYPTGYIIQAQSLKLLKNIHTADYGRAITRGEVAELLYASFDVPLYEATGFGEYIEVTAEKGNTLLSKYHNVYQGYGVVTANEITAVNSNTNTKENTIAIDDERYNISLENTNDLIGLNVKVYYHMDESEIRTVKHITPYKNEIVTISDEKFSGLNGYVFEYFEKPGRKKTIKIEANTNIIWNGQYFTRAVNIAYSDLSAVNGSIDFIDNDNDDKIEVMRVNSYKTAVVENVNVTEEKISCKYNTPYIDLRDKTFVVLSDGTEVELGDILSGDVLMLAPSKQFESNEDESFIEITICKETVSGTISSYEDDEVNVTLEDGTTSKYYVSPYYVSKDGAGIKMGDSGTFYLDTNNKIVHLEDGGITKTSFGYLIRANKIDDYEERIELKILTSEGVVERFPVKDRVKLDGTSKSSLEMYDRLKQIKADFKMLIRYSLNKQNEIDLVDTTAANSDGDSDALTQISLSGTLRYQSEANMLVSMSTSERYRLASDTIIFEIPYTAETDDDYGVLGLGYFKNAEYYNVSNYKVYNMKDVTPKVIVMETNTPSGGSTIDLTSNDSIVGVIKKIANVYDTERGECTKLTIMMNGTEVEVFTTDRTKYRISGDATVYTSSDFSNIFSFGDAVAYDVDKKNQLNELYRVNAQKVYNLKHDQSGNTYSVSGMSGYAELIMGSVRKRVDTLLELDVNQTPNLYINAKSPRVYIVNTSEKTVTTGTVSDIWASTNDLEADKIFARNRNGAVKEIVVYRD